MIKYRGGYKYQLAEQYHHWLDIRPEQPIADDFISLDIDGHLILHKGYACDGPSGPTFDTPTFIRGAFVHDAGYQLIRNQLLPDSTREYWDKLLYRICRDAGMSSVRAWYVLKAVRVFGLSSARGARPVLVAP